MSESNESYRLYVPAPEQTGQDNYVMEIPTLSLLVSPNQNTSWDISPSELMGELHGNTESLNFNNIEIGFLGENVLGEDGFQAATIRYTLQGDYEWHGNGIDVTLILADEEQVIRPKNFEYFINHIDKKTIELTVEIERQVELHGQLSFRFKAKLAGQTGLNTEVFVSEDPVVQPTKPIGN